MRIRSVCAAIFGLLICQATPVSATVYNIDIFGSLPDGVTRDPSGTASTNACSATTCAGGWNTAYSFYAQPGDTINFGSLVLSSFIFGDGRQLQSTQYIDENGQLQWTYGTPTAVYSGSLAVSEIYRPFLQLNYSWDGICNSGVPSCFPFLQSRMTSRTVDLVFTLTTGFIELGWTSPATYIAPRASSRRGSPGALNLGHDVPWLRWHWLHNVSPSQDRSTRSLIKPKSRIEGPPSGGLFVCALPWFLS
jgi:hypothetical protein